MTNYKSEIAEALFDSSVKVSREALVWAMSNLPDDKNHGSFSKFSPSVKREFSHESENIWDAVGISTDELTKAGELMSESLRKINDSDGKVSLIVESVLDAAVEHPFLFTVIAVKTVQDALEHVSEAGEMAKMMKMVKMMDKLKKRMDDEDNQDS